LGNSVVETAYGAYLIANSNIKRAITSVSSERGRDPRKFSLIVFGGAGALHAAEVAKALGIKHIIIPPYGGIFSAFGLLCANIEHNYVQSFESVFQSNSLESINTILSDLEERALVATDNHGYDHSQVKITRFADLRYLRQSSELHILLPTGKLEEEHLRSLHSDFDSEYQRQFGHHFPGKPLEVANLRLTSIIDIEPPVINGLDTGTPLMNNNKSKSRKAYFGPEYGIIDVPVIEISEIGHALVDGPVFFDTYDTTIVVPPYCNVKMANNGNLLIDIAGEI